MPNEIDAILTKHLNNFVSEISQFNTDVATRSISNSTSLQITNVCSINQVRPKSGSWIEGGTVSPKPSALNKSLDSDEINVMGHDDHEEANVANETSESENDSSFVTFEPLKEPKKQSKEMIGCREQPRKVKFTGFLKESGWEDSNVG